MSEPNADDEHPLDSVEKAVGRTLQGLRGFAADMREQGIHVGLGNPPRCVTCGEMWPCSHEQTGSYSDPLP